MLYGKGPQTNLVSLASHGHALSLVAGHPLFAVGIIETIGLDVLASTLSAQGFKRIRESPVKHATVRT
jgi:hypothetical protein